MTEQSKEAEKLKLVLERQTEHFQMTLNITEDRLRLFLDCTPIDPEKAKEITAATLLEVIKEVIDPSKVDSNLIQDIARQLNSGEAVQMRRIARGKEVINGREGRCVLLVKTYREPKAGETVEIVDQRFIRFFDNVEKGAIIGRVYPPTAGTDGVDAVGAPIKASPGKAAKLTLDKTLSSQTINATDGFQSLIANESGYLLDKGGKLSIQSELVIEGDVDFRTGDIDFICKVIVKNSVMKGFTVRAGGDIEVHGNVVGGSLISRSGSVKVKGRILGDSAEEVTVTSGVTSAALTQIENKYHAVIRAANILLAESMEGADVEAECDVEVLNEARDCSIWTKGLVRLPKGHLFGGNTFSACGLEAKMLGTPSGAKTEITLSSDVEATKHFLGLLKEIKKAENVVETCVLYLGPLALNPERISTLTSTLRKKTEQLLQKLSAAQETLAGLHKQKAEAMAAARENTKLRVNVHVECYAGVKVIVGDKTFSTDNRLQGPITIEYNEKGGSFEVVELRNLECVVPEHCVLP